MITIPFWLFATILFCAASLSATFGFLLFSVFKIGGETDGKK